MSYGRPSPPGSTGQPGKQEEATEEEEEQEDEEEKERRRDQGNKEVERHV